MNILLMTPLSTFMSSYPNIPDLGLGYLATAIRKAGHRPYILGWNNNLTTDEFKKYLADNKPDVVGIKVFTHNINAVLKTISLIKTFDRSITVIIGGPHPSASSPSETMTDFAEADFAFRGDSEIGLPAFMELISGEDSFSSLDSKELDKIPGLIRRENGEIKASPPQFHVDLETTGLPAWDLIPPGDYNFYRIEEDGGDGYVAPVIATRGCPLSCTYCSVSLVNGNKIRRRSNKSITDEIELLYNDYNVRQITIMDTSFLSDKHMVKEFCELLIQKGLTVKWDCICDTLIKNFYDDEILDLMYRAGCRKIIMGMESGADRVLKILKKSWHKAQFAEVISMMKSHNIKVQGYFMFGFPDETMEDMVETRDFALTADFDRVFFNICYPLPGTEIYEYLRQKYKLDRIVWKDFAVETSPYPLGNVSSKEVVRFFHKANLMYLIRSANSPRAVLHWAFLINLIKSTVKVLFSHFFGISKRIKQC